MTVRNRALGRTRAAFAATTLYIRGDVVSYLGALYAAKETFTSGASFVAADWDEVIPAPVFTVAPRTSQASVNTVGPGLPAFTGRLSGDVHWDSTAKKEYVLTGLVGSFGKDDFNRANGSLGSFVSNGTTYTWTRTGGNPNSEILNNALSQGGGFGFISNPYFILAGANTANIEVGLTSTKAGNMGVSARDQYIAWFNSGTLFLSKRQGSTFASPVPGGAATKAQVSLAAIQSWVALASGAKVRISLSIIDSLIIASLTSEDGGITYASASWTDPSPTTSGTDSNTVGFAHDKGGVGDDFTFQSLGTLKWERTEVDFVLPTRTTQSSVNTIGAGLPGFADRVAGDGHFDTTPGRFYLLDGVGGTGGTPQSDDFSVGAGGAGLSAPWTGVFGTIRYVGDGTIHATALSGTPGAVYVRTTDSGDGQVSIRSLSATGANILLVARREVTINMYWVDFGTKTIHKKVNSTDSQIGSWTGNDPGVGGLMSFSFIGSLLTVYINGNQVAQVTDTSIPNTLMQHGLGFSASGVPADDWSYGAAQGSLKWNVSEPIYLQAQLATGPVAVGTHVLKPGIRVPAACTLKEVVLRADTIPLGSPITVTVERFNNGASQGIIATASIADGATVGSVTGLSAGCAKGDMLRFNITAVGSTSSGADLTASLELR